MSTIHLVDPSAREVAGTIPPFDPASQSVAGFRAFLPTLFAPPDPAAASAGETHHAPGHDGAPDVRVLLYRPRHRPDHAIAAILSFHGGGMIAGSPDIFEAGNQALADATGAIVAALDYRLAPEHPFPAAVEDGHAALTWLFAHATRLGIDPARIAVMGESAGGGLAAATALLARDRATHRLAAQILIYPMLDPRTGTPDAPVDNPTTGEFMWTRAANRFGWDALRGTDPIPPDRLGHFAPALAVDLANLPPTFIAVGALDLFLEENIDHARRLSRAGVAVELHVYPGAVHGFNAFPGALADQFTADLDAALDRLLSHPPVDAGPAEA